MDEVEIVSLGSNCSPGLSLRELGLKSETYPFDWVRTNSKIILDVLENGYQKYLSFGSNIISDAYYLSDIHMHTHAGKFPKSHINWYGQHFTHYTNISQRELKIKFHRYLTRFTELLKKNKKILFIHTSEEYIYHKKSRDATDELYGYLCKINDHIINTHPSLQFVILNIEVDNTHENYGNIINKNMTFKCPLSDYCEHHSPECYSEFRKETTKILQSFINDELSPTT
jgi:hypothetical protein